MNITDQNRYILHFTFLFSLFVFVSSKISQQPENCENRHFKRNGGVNQILKRQASRFHYDSKVPAVTITVL
jgi:hypothetical protein